MSNKYNIYQHIPAFILLFLSLGLISCNNKDTKKPVKKTLVSREKNSNTQKKEITIHTQPHPSLVATNPMKQLITDEPQKSPVISTKNQDEETKRILPVSGLKAEISSNTVGMSISGENMLPNQKVKYEIQFHALLAIFKKAQSLQELEDAANMVSYLLGWISACAGYSIPNDEKDPKICLVDQFTQIRPFIKRLLEADVAKKALEQTMLSAYEIKLVRCLYELNYHLASAHLMLISYVEDPKEIQKNVEGYKGAKGQLVEVGKQFIFPFKLPADLYKQYLHELADFHENMVETDPKVRGAFYPHSFKPSQPKKYSAKVNKIKTANQAEEAKKIYQKEGLEKAMPEVRFFKQANELLQKFASLKFSQQNAEVCMEAYNQLIELEQFGYTTPNLNPSLVNTPELVQMDTRLQFYKNVARLSSSFNIYVFMKCGITLCVWAERLDEAMVRLETMKKFYTHVCPLPINLQENYQFFQATVHALCGNYDQLNQLHQNLIQKELSRRKKLAQKHQRMIQKIKDSQQSQAKVEMPHPTPEQLTKIQTSLPKKDSQSDLLQEAVWKELQETCKQEETDRLRRHQEAAIERKQKKLVANTPLPEMPPEVLSNRLEEKQVNESRPANDTIAFLIPNKPFKTLSKIFNNDWNIGRKDIENLLEQLGNSIHTKTKSSHHIIQIPQAIALVQEETDESGQKREKIVATITGLSAEMQGHLSLPDWGLEVIPKYMQSQILRLLQAIGIQKDNYAKGTDTVYHPMKADISSPMITEVKK